MPAPKGHPPYPGCENGGRPLMYTKELIEKYADELIIWLDDPENYWYKDFCHEKKIHPKKMSEWAATNEKFKESLELAKSIQESRVFKGSMTNKYNSNMSKMHLVNHHDWCDKSETKLSGSSTDPMIHLIVSSDNCTKDIVNDTHSRTDRTGD